MGEVVTEANKGVLDNVKNSLSDFVSSSKEGIMNNGVVNKGSEAISASTQIVSKAVSNISVENTKDAIMNAMSDSSSSLYFIVVLLVIAAFVCYILYYIITDTVINQQKILIPGTEMPIICTERRTFPFTQKLESGNGNWLRVGNESASSIKIQPQTPGIRETRRTNSVIVSRIR